MYGKIPSVVCLLRVGSAIEDQTSKLLLMCNERVIQNLVLFIVRPRYLDFSFEDKRHYI